MSLMNPTTPPGSSVWPKRAKIAVLILAGTALALVAFGFYTGQPGFFLKWFFGLQADD